MVQPFTTHWYRMNEVSAKLKTCLQKLRGKCNLQLAEALLQTKDAFTDVEPWRELPTPRINHPQLPRVRLQVREAEQVWCDYALLPLKAFRTDAERFFCGEQVAARYRSSGTTAATRALSLFSEEGLLFYKFAAVSCFASVLQRRWGDEAQAAQGVSLIDFTEPQSSLGAMLRWFTEFWPLPALDGDALRQQVARVDPARPFFLWATSWQLLQLLETSRQPLVLPPRSIVIETGGFKNLHGDLSVQEFRSRVCAFFGIATDALLGEYGMCELAAQAWCWERERFVLPVWTRALVSDDGERVAEHGRGALCIYDPLRVDYPYMLCTEDLVSIDARREFQLHGRVPHAPRRGCSLDVRLTLSQQDNLQFQSMQPKRSDGKMASSTDFDAERFVLACKKFLGSKNSVASLSQELGSEQLARDALRELLASFPNDWETALANSFPDRTLRNWLFILPSNHSLTGIYPLMFACLLGLRVLVKLSPSLVYLRRFVAFISSRYDGVSAITVEHQELQIPNNVDALLCYSSDQTLAALRANTLKPISGFGTHDTVTVSSLDHLLKFPQLHIRDAFHLSQRGCLTSKMLFLVLRSDQKITATYVRILEENFRVFYGEKLNTAYQARVEAERIRYVRKLGAVFCSTACPAFPILRSAELDFEEALPRASFVWPIVVVRDVKELTALLRRHRSIKTIVQPGSPTQRSYRNGRCFVRPGYASRLVWDGTHEGQPLFAVQETITTRHLYPPNSAQDSVSLAASP